MPGLPPLPRQAPNRATATSGLWCFSPLFLNETIILLARDRVIFKNPTTTTTKEKKQKSHAMQPQDMELVLQTSNLGILLPLPSAGWYYRSAPPCPAASLFHQCLVIVQNNGDILTHGDHVLQPHPHSPLSVLLLLSLPHAPEFKSCA